VNVLLLGFVILKFQRHNIKDTDINTIVLWGSLDNWKKSLTAKKMTFLIHLVCHAYLSALWWVIIYTVHWHYNCTSVPCNILVSWTPHSLTETKSPSTMLTILMTILVMQKRGSRNVGSISDRGNIMTYSLLDVLRCVSALSFSSPPPFNGYFPSELGSHLVFHLDEWHSVIGGLAVALPTVWMLWRKLQALISAMESHPLASSFASRQSCASIPWYHVHGTSSTVSIILCWSSALGSSPLSLQSTMDRVQLLSMSIHAQLCYV